MAVDRIDLVAIVGFGSLVAASIALEPLVIGAGIGGFALSLSSWRLYDGRPWEALAWLAWVGAAVSVVVVPDGTAFVIAFFGCLLVGLGLLLGARLGWLPEIWHDSTTDNESGERVDEQTEH